MAWSSPPGTCRATACNSIRRNCRAQKKSEKKEFYFITIAVYRVAFWAYCYFWLLPWCLVKAYNNFLSGPYGQRWELGVAAGPISPLHHHATHRPCNASPPEHAHNPAAARLKPAPYPGAPR
jgi:hypothetical protein